MLDKAGSPVWSIFRRDGSVVTVREGEGLQLYCAVLVRKERASSEVGRAGNFLRWTGSNPGARDSEPTLDLSSQVRRLGKTQRVLFLIMLHM